MKVKESEGKWKCTQLRLTLYDPTDYTVHGILQARILEWIAVPFSRGSPKPGIEPRSLHCRQILYHTGVGSLSLLQQIFPTQELNWSLLHWRQILYQLSYRESPCSPICVYVCVSCSVVFALCDPKDCSPPGFSVHGILQARILESVAVPSFRGSSQSRDWTQASHLAGRFFTS